MEGAEGELLRRARDGEHEAVALLFGRSRERVVALCFQILRDRDGAEDAAQEVLLRAFDKMPTFRGESEFSTWLYRLALNHCLEQSRKAARRAGLDANAPDVLRHAPDIAAQIETRIPSSARSTNSKKGHA